MERGPVPLAPQVLEDPARLKRHLHFFHSLWMDAGATVDDLYEAHTAVHAHPLGPGDAGTVEHTHEERTAPDTLEHGFW